MIVLKLGGSLLTDKARYRVLREGEMRRLSREVATAGRAVALVHGAGSFGHVLAKRFALADGRRGTREQDAAAARVHRDVRELNLLLLGALADEGARAVSVSTADVALLANGALQSFDAEPYRRAQAAGLTPVGFGDVVPDAARGYGILSADVLVERLAAALKPDLAVFATDVDGIFDRAPHEPGARLIPEMRAADAVHAVAGESRGVDVLRSGATKDIDDSRLRSGVVDVTGGMASKLARAAAVAKAGVPVLIVNGAIPGRVAAALRGESVVGTRIGG